MREHRRVGTSAATTAKRILSPESLTRSLRDHPPRKAIVPNLTEHAETVESCCRCLASSSAALNTSESSSGNVPARAVLRFLGLPTPPLVYGATTSRRP